MNIGSICSTAATTHVPPSLHCVDPSPWPVHLLRRFAVPSEMIVAANQPLLMLVQSGTPSLAWQDHLIRLDPGCVFASDGRVPTLLRCDAERRAEVLCLWPDPASLHGAGSNGLASRLLTLVHEPEDAVAIAMQRLAATVVKSGQRRVDDPELLHAWLAELLCAQQGLRAAIDRCHGRSEERRCELFLRLARARALLRSPGSGDDMTECARVAHLSTSHFVRLFHKVFGESPHRYRHAARMNRARDLLLGTDLAVGEVTRRIGFESLASFSRAFRQHFGVSARELRAGAGVSAHRRPFIGVEHDDTIPVESASGDRREAKTTGFARAA